MKYDKKIAHMQTELSSVGISEKVHSPLVFRLFWICGLPIKPPLYLSRIGLMLIHGSVFGLISFLLTFEIGSIILDIILLIPASAIFGWYSSGTVVRAAVGLNLPPWDGL